ncbi:flagellar motor switch protein FliM [Alienimonas californiensis]|uniref:Flagellar motor switch protein FliM n=1 Tax=Alienimonas californiensis TaxID=2527989 RepID=A0A517PF87_9PLAN|nr:flagellar motor switch protein FliM [Alienimonas californiensis]QDT18043.1 Flagellar motor switch protein FliM [Alienimonas californiensis]
MSDVLTESEVESLLAALEPNGPAATAPVSRGDADANGVSLYDFKRPERVSKEQIRALRGLHEGFSREFGAGLSNLMRTIVEVKLVAVDQLTYGEFLFSLENPTCFNLLRAASLDGHMVLELSPAVVYPLVDRLLGGGRGSGAGDPPPDRPLTDIESRLVGRMTTLAIEALERTWESLTDLQLSLVQTESNPQLVQVVPPNEVVVLVAFELTLGEARGMMNLCIPFNTLEPVAARFSGDAWSTYGKRSSDPRERVVLDRGVSRARVPLDVTLAITTLTARDLADLAPGDVILTECDSREGLELRVGGKPAFRCRPGALRGHKAVRVTGPVLKPVDPRLVPLGEAKPTGEAVANASAGAGS